MDPIALVTTTELAERLPFVMDADELREATGALEDLSDDARLYGSELWLTPTSAPRQVKSLVMRAAARHMKNYDGFVSSRAGDEAVAWTDRGEGAGSAYFTEKEIKALRAMAHRTGLSSAPTTPWRTRSQPADEFVPTSDTGSTKPFPFYAAEDGGW